MELLCVDMLCVELFIPLLEFNGYYVGLGTIFTPPVPIVNGVVLSPSREVEVFLLTSLLVPRLVAEGFFANIFFLNSSIILLTVGEFWD